MGKTDPVPAPGLVMIQIDGLSRPQLERALQHGRMPHLSRLLENGTLKSNSVYSGLPSCTPAVQAELFYGVKNAVPSFAFLDTGTGEIVKMYSPRTAKRMQYILQGHGRPLLKGGASYSNIFDGGALRSSYCACQMGFSGIMGNLRSLGLIPLVFRNPFRLARILGLMAREAVAAVRDAFRPETPLDGWIRETVFIINRIFMSVLVREIVTILAARDIRHGLPVVHVNFVGYDEHAHRRGPASLSAHAHLREIDAVISRLSAAIAAARKRSYQCWIYSDHGQEAVRSYQAVAGRSLEAAMRDIAGGIPVIRLPDPHSFPVPYRLRNRGKTPGSFWLVANPGPLVSLYSSQPLSLEERENLSMSLVRDGSVPMVFHSPGRGRVRAYSKSGWRELPEAGPDILGTGHPFPEECIRDLMTLCRHPLAGTLIVSGWIPGETPLSFFSEAGSHGGIGREEVHGFILLPAGAVLPNKPYLRFLDIREMALKAIGS